MVKHDSLDKAPLNDEALSRQQKLYSGSRFISHKVYLLSCTWARKLPGDNPVDAGLLCNNATVGNCVLYAYNFQLFSYWNVTHFICLADRYFTKHNKYMSSLVGKRILILQGLKFIIFSTASSRIRRSDSSWSGLKHLVSYKIPCASNEQGKWEGHQSPA